MEKIFKILENNNIFFCEICKKLISINNDLNEINKNYNPKNKKNIQINILNLDEIKKLDFSKNSYCFLCFNLFYKNNIKYKNLLEIELKKKLNEYEHKNIKLITNFSCIFNIIFWFINLKIENLIKKNYFYIFENDTLRKIFKIIFTPIFEENLNEKFILLESNRDLDLEINFDFSNDFYDKINEIIKSCNNNQFEEKYYLSKNKGKSTTNLIIQEIINKLLFTKLDNFLSIENIINNLIINFNYIPIPIYISGNYIKLSREIGQTKWIRDNKVFSLSSIDEEMKKILKNFFNNSENDFILSAGGREDRDVRMLGNGRSFIYEILNAKKKYNLNYKKINEEFNNKSKIVKIKDLNEWNKKEYLKIKKSENEKIKKYIAIIYIKNIINENDVNKINSTKDLEINQITPLRVLHKRVLKERKKTIINLKVLQKINDHFIILEIIASAGTYIKEFIHSDLGRTNPSLKKILNCNCDILQLDVSEIKY